MIAIYIAAVFVISVQPCWNSSFNQIQPPGKNVGYTACSAYLCLSFYGAGKAGRYAAYHNILNSGRVITDYNLEAPRNKWKPSKVLRKLSIYLLMTLFIDDDVHPNPGPVEPAQLPEHGFIGIINLIDNVKSPFGQGIIYTIDNIAGARIGDSSTVMDVSRRRGYMPTLQ